MTDSSLTGLATEGVDPRFSTLDAMSVSELAFLMNDVDHAVPEAIHRELPQIVTALEVISAAFNAGGRIIYVGAGTSGRLGVLDASECPPTFNTDPERVVGLIAGGDYALRHPIEGAEDDPEQGAADLDEIGISAADAVVGIASSGRTPYVLGALRRAREVGAVTVALACNEDSEIGGAADYPIEVVVGPEIVAGSTRLKSGTAQKMVLNMITTITMIRAGKVFGNRMIDVRASNHKLRVRATKIVSDLADVDEPRAEQMLQTCEWKVKPAVVALLRGIDAQEAQARLDQAQGSLREALSL